MLYITSDHAGYDLKEKIRAFLQEHNIAFKDMGAFKFDKDDDYPDFALKTAQKVAQDPENNKAILICETGIGMAITANKVKGVYCAQVWQRDLARKAQEHNNVNAIAFGARYIDEKEAYLSIQEFLQANVEIEKRHKRRFNKVVAIE